MKLHYSQTLIGPLINKVCFTTLWNYTTLKQSLNRLRLFQSFTTLWNYTTLKLNPLNLNGALGFTTLWNYTTLKLILIDEGKTIVLLPYEITLLSNVTVVHSDGITVLLPY